MIRAGARSYEVTIQPIYRKQSQAILLAVVALAPWCVYADDSPADAARKEYARRFLEPDAHLLLARQLVSEGKQEMAFCLMENARQRFGDDLFNLAHLKAFSRPEPIDAGEASEKRLLESLAKKPDDLETVARLADVYLVRGEFDRAAQYAEKACKLAPDRFEYVERLNIINELRHRGEDAEKAFEDFVTRNPDSSMARAYQYYKTYQSDPAAAARLLDEAIEKDPNEGELLLYRAAELMKTDRLDDAENAYLKAAQLSPRSSRIQGSLGWFYLKKKENENKAIEYYLNAYFLDPHYYDGEFAEFRLSEMLNKRNRSQYQNLRSNTTDLAPLLRHDSFTVVFQALRDVDQNWRPEYLDSVVTLLTYDYEGVRWRATQALMNNAGDDFDKRLHELLLDPDDYRRGCAAYIAAGRWKEKSFDELRRLLKDNSQLVQFDALSALMMTELPDAKNIAREELKDTKNQYLREMLNHLE